MPNMLGGSQHHPDYDPRTEIGPNQILIGRDLYTVKRKVDDSGFFVSLESVNGDMDDNVFRDYLPKEATELMKRMEK